MTIGLDKVYLNKKIEKFFGTGYEGSILNHQNKTTIYNRDGYLNFYLSRFPGCCAMGILHNISGPLISDNFILRKLISMTLEISRDTGFTRLYYSTIKEQTEINQALIELGFIEADSLVSRTTKRNITLWVGRT